MQAVGHKCQTVSVYPAKVSFVIAFKNRYVKNALSRELFHIPTCQKIPDDLRSNLDLAISAFPRSQGVGAVPNVFSRRKVSFICWH